MAFRNSFRLRFKGGWFAFRCSLTCSVRGWFVFSEALTGSRAHPGEPVGLVSGLGGVDGLRHGFWGVGFALLLNCIGSR